MVYISHLILCSSLDDNECARTVCHQYATCIDTIGSYRCQCNQGFTGDGTSCEGINNCNVYWTTIDPAEPAISSSARDSGPTFQNLSIKIGLSPSSWIETIPILSPILTYCCFVLPFDDIYLGKCFILVVVYIRLYINAEVVVQSNILVWFCYVSLGSKAK